VVIAGRRGTGKTALAVKTAIASLRKGEDVWLNFPIDLQCEKNLKGRCYFADKLEDIGDMRNGVFILDEAHLHASAREWQKMTVETHAYLSLSRHLGMTLIFISQNFRRVDGIIREQTNQPHPSPAPSSRLLSFPKNRAEAWTCSLQTVAGSRPKTHHRQA